MLSGLHPTQEVHPNWLLLCCCPSSARIKTELIIFSLFWWRNRMKVQLPRGLQSCPLILSVLQAIRSSCHTHWSGTAGGFCKGGGFGWVLLCLKLWGLLSVLAARATETCRLHDRSDGIKRRENSRVEPLPVLCVCVFFYSRRKCRCSAPRKDQDEPKRTNIRYALCGAQFPRSAPPFDIHEVSCSQTRVRELTRFCRSSSQHIIYALTGA